MLAITAENPTLTRIRAPRLEPRSSDLGLTAILLELPVAVIQWTHIARLQPARDAMEMERVIANTPRNRAIVAASVGLRCLALDTQVHDVVAADGTVVNHDIPRPQRHRIPLLDLELGFGVRINIGWPAVDHQGHRARLPLGRHHCRRRRRGGSIGHIDISHG